MGRDNRRDNRSGGGFGGGGRSNGRNSGGFGGNRGDDRQMHHAVCSSCGNDCQVPFRPSNDKPIYCDSCFGKNKKRDDRGSKNFGGGRDFDSKPKGSVNCDCKEDIKAINSKIGQILKILQASSNSEAEEVVTEIKKKVEPKEEKPAKREAKKEVKKVVAKKEVKKSTKKAVAKKTVKKSAKKATKKK